MFKRFFTGLVAAMLVMVFYTVPGNCEDMEKLLENDTLMAGFLQKRLKYDLPKLIEITAIRVGTVYSQTNFFFSAGQKKGFEYNLVEEYAKNLNAELKKKKKRPVTIIYILLHADEAIPALNEGRVDIVAAGKTITPERAKKIAFTTPYLSDVSELVVTNKALKDLNKLEDLSGRNVYVRKSSSYYQSLVKLNKDLAAKKIKPVKIQPVDETLATEDILEMVNAGIVDITIADSQIANLWSQVMPDITVHKNLAVATGGKLAWMVRKDSPKLKASLDKFMATHKKGTKLGNIYFNRYFKDTKWIKNPNEARAREEWKKYRNWFIKYGELYGIDPVLIAAQAFVESGFDPNAKSHAGAIGIMQLLPSLADDERVGIKDLHEPENNIHAGVKYLALIRDTYFGDKKLNPDEQIRFALAAYNAGPTRLSRIRNMADDMGYNPDIWFLETEVATQRKVSSEPVRYVRKINTIYVAYKMALEHEHEKEKLKGQITGQGAGGK